MVNPITTSKDLPPLVHNGTIYETHQDKANILNTYFQSQTLLQAPQNPTFPPLSPNTHILEDFDITIQDVTESINVLKVGKASGPDAINSYVLKEVVSEIASPLRNLFSYSLRCGNVPMQWKIAHVCAIYKNSHCQDVSSYRPIYLLSVVSKVLERILHKCMFIFYRETDFFTPFQSGFVPKDSTVNKPLSIYHYICIALDEGKEVRAVFCNISKAFDRVWHGGLLLKLGNSGIQGRLISWLSDYLYDKQQRV